MRAIRSRLTHSSRSLLLGRVDYGESDLVVTMFTEGLGRISALARAARRSKKRFVGALEPMHTLRISVDEPSQGELFTLREAAIDFPRTRLTRDLDALRAAGKALAWVRKAAPPRTPEPALWRALVHCLDGLDQDPTRHEERLTEFGIRLLGAVGWGLDLSRCVRCGKACPPDQAALVSPERGGLVCRACGGGPLRLPGILRQALLRTAQGEDDVLPSDELPRALQLVDRALAAHMGFE